MNFDDIIYLLCLLTSIGIGPYFRKIENHQKRKLFATGFGCLLVFIVSGFHILHCLISFILCALVITKIHPSKSHIASFCVMFGYLVFFRTTSFFGIPNPPGHTNMIQMVLTLKLAGVAFEMNTAYNKIEQRNKGLSGSQTEKVEKKEDDKSDQLELTEYDVEIQNMTIEELFHYSFNYIGVMTGPYYRYRTYRDYFETPFKDHADYIGATLEKLKWCGFYGLIYVVANYIWPLSYALSSEFYEDRSVLYRLYYVLPTFLVFRSRIFTGLLLGECVCTSASFGAYPTITNVVKGEGPKNQYLHCKRDPEQYEYNFETIRNLDIYNVETCSTFRETLRHWNICVQYWLAMNVYKRFPNKKYRTIATLITSAFWHGFYPGHYFCIMGGPFYIPVEELHNKLWRKDEVGIKRKIIDIIFLISKSFILGYLGIAFVLLNFDKIWFYYSSVYHLGYIYYFFLVISGFVFLKMKKSSKKGNRQLTTQSGGDIHLSKED